jgi:Spy/CpxP family protein refolding chaperone
MLKQRLLILIAAGAISVAAPFAVAQDTPPSDQPAPPSAMQGNNGGGWHHGPMDPAQRTAELTRRLKLTPEQQPKVQEILTSEKSQMESLRADTATAPQDRRPKMMEIHKTSDTQIRALLDSVQQKKWDEMQARREQMMQNRRGGPPSGGDQPAPPPQ